MQPIRLLLTHPGGAHKDEFLACSVMLAIHSIPIVRREPTQADLDDPAVCVIDVGNRHEPERRNFDHHQFPKDHVPTCSLSLVLQNLNLYTDARRYCEWLETTEWFDCRGPVETANWLGIARDVLDRLMSPIDVTILRRFSQSKRLEAGDPIWEVMLMIGEDLLSYVRSLRERMDYLGRHAEFWTVELPGGSAKVLYVPRIDPLPEESSLGLELFVESKGMEHEVVGMVYPDRRGPGYGLSRFQDDQRLDFTRIAGQPEVHFAHTRGFVAKTSAVEVGRLRELMIQSSP